MASSTGWWRRCPVPPTSPSRPTTNCAPDARFKDPIFDYSHASGCTAITGGAFVPEGAWPAPYSGSYLFSDYVCGTIFRLAPKAGGGFTMEPLVDGLGYSSAVSMTFGQTGGIPGLYYTSYALGGEIRRLVYGTPETLPPTASFTASPTTATSAPLTVHFDASASVDPDHDALTYRWNFGDGTPIFDTTTPAVDHTYTANGGYTATLKVVDDTQESSPVSKVIGVGLPPKATIVGPDGKHLFSVREAFTLTGTGVDGNGNPLPASALSWEVLRHHDTHTHPYYGPLPGNNIKLQYPVPEDLPGAATSYLQVRLTVTAPGGQKTTVTKKLLPNKVTVTFKTNRSAPLQLRANDQVFKGTKSFTSWAGYSITVSAPSPQVVGGKRYRFKSWSDKKAATHLFVTGTASKTLTATYRRG